MVPRVRVRCIVVADQLLLEAESGTEEVRSLLEFTLRLAERVGGGARRGPFLGGSITRPRLYGSVRGTTARGVAAAARVLLLAAASGGERPTTWERRGRGEPAEPARHLRTGGRANEPAARALRPQAP